MEKKIVLTMLPSKDIVIEANGDESMRISKDNRTVKADDIYNLLNYSRDDTYVIESQNPEEKDAPVLGFFTDLIKDITNQLHKMGEDGDDSDEI